MENQIEEFKRLNKELEEKIENRIKLVLRAREEGLRFSQIADMLGVTKQRAHQIYQKHKGRGKEQKNET